MKHLIFVYRGSSMRGTFRQGDVLLVTRVSAGAIRRGDVVAFSISSVNHSKRVVTHRVRANTPFGFVTQGDNWDQPDREVVRPGALIGRVSFARRGDRTRRVWRGWAGLLWVRTLRLWRKARSFSRWLYRCLRSSGVVRLLWKPRVEYIYLIVESDLLVKYVCGRSTVAYWWPDRQLFWCRKPYDLIIQSPLGSVHWRD
jgi:hypothetical protein